MTADNSGVVDQIFFQCGTGKSPNPVMPRAASRNVNSTLGSWPPSMPAMVLSCALTCSRRVGQRWCRSPRRPCGGALRNLGHYLSQDMHAADGLPRRVFPGRCWYLLADVAADDGLEIEGGLPILLNLAGRSEVDVDVPARRWWGLIDILDDRARLGGTGGRGHQIVEWVLDGPLRVA